MNNLKLLLICAFLITNFSKAQDAKEIFRKHLNVVENYQNRKPTLISELHISAKFLAEITTINFEVLDSYEFSRITSKKNLSDWKKWYRKNKKKLYWDKDEQRVKTK